MSNCRSCRQPVSLNDLINEAHRTAVSKGWWGEAQGCPAVLGGLAIDHR